MPVATDSSCQPTEDDHHAVSHDVLAAIDAAVGTARVKARTLAPLAQEGVLHR